MCTDCFGAPGRVANQSIAWHVQELVFLAILVLQLLRKLRLLGGQRVWLPSDRRHLGRAAGRGLALLRGLQQRRCRLPFFPATSGLLLLLGRGSLVMVVGWRHLSVCVLLLLLQLFLVVLLHLPLHKHLTGILTEQVLRDWMAVFARDLLLVALHIMVVRTAHLLISLVFNGESISIELLFIVFIFFHQA